MYTVVKEHAFAAAHFIRGHQGECQHLHGHNYRVRVSVSTRALDALGMVIDFADLKRAMREVLDPFDHRVINEIPPFDHRNTTAELLAEYIWEEMARRLEDGRVKVSKVEVWETDTSCATFEPRGGS